VKLPFFKEIISYWWYVAYTLQLVLWGCSRLSAALTWAAPPPLVIAGATVQPLQTVRSLKYLPVPPKQASQQSQKLSGEFVFESSIQITCLLMLRYSEISHLTDESPPP